MPTYKPTKPRRHYDENFLKNEGKKPYKDHVILKTTDKLNKSVSTSIRLTWPVFSMLKDMADRNERSVNDVLEYILRYHMTTDPIYEVPVQGDKHEDLFEKGKFRRYLWTHKENAELTCKADPRAKVVSKKEFEKDELGYLEMELPS